MSQTTRPARVRRTVLAVPGSSDRFIAKARALGVDALFLDLEDAVAPPVKAESRRRIVDALNDTAGFAAPTVTVRVNDWSTPWTYADVIEIVEGAGDHLDALVLPKCTDAAQVRALDLLLTQVEHTAGLPSVPHDADQMQQVFINLLKNAAEASSPGARITVRSARSPGPAGGVQVTVRITVERDLTGTGEVDPKPACVADTVSRFFP